MWKIVEISKVTVLYIYIYIYIDNKVWYKLKYVLRIRVKCEIVVRIFKEFSDKVIGLMSFSI